METYCREGLLIRYRISFLINILLLVIIFIYLLELDQTGIPVKITSYEKQDLTVRSLEALTGGELGAEGIEGVLIIKNKSDEQADLIFYSKGFSGTRAGAGSSMKELMLQLGSGSMDVYAGDGECRSVFIYRGQIYCIPW